MKQSRGCALEARIYAENPLQDFLPATGDIRYLHTPETPAIPLQTSEDRDPVIRVDSGVRSGGTVSPFYDPLLAKLIVYAEDRPSTLALMERALRGFRVSGLPTNIPFLVQLTRHPAFANKLPTTAFFDEHLQGILEELRQGAEASKGLDKHLQFALLAFLQAELRANQGSGVEGQLWAGSGSQSLVQWRALRPQIVSRQVRVACGSGSNIGPVQQVRVNVHPQNAATLWLSLEASAELEESKGDLAQCEPEQVQLVRSERLKAHTDGASVWQLSAQLGEHLINGTVSLFPRSGSGGSGSGLQADVWLEGRLAEEPTQRSFWLPLSIKGSSAGKGKSKAGDGGLLLSPMPGRVVKLSVPDGSLVKAGESLLVLEAMKMEHIIIAPCDG